MCHHNVRICVWVVLWLIVIGSKAVVSKLSSQLMDLDGDLILLFHICVRGAGLMSVYVGTQTFQKHVI